MNRIFGASSSAKPKPSLQDAISATDTRVETINVKIRKLDAELTRYRDQMKRLRDGPGKQAVQKRALGVLKQKKMYEAQLDSIQAQVFNMENAALTTDNLRNTMATVDAMKQANKEMKKTYGKLDIDKIEVPFPSKLRCIFNCDSIVLKLFDTQSIHYDMEDLIEQANEIQESLGRTYGVPDEVDEADLEAGKLSLNLLEN